MARRCRVPVPLRASGQGCRTAVKMTVMQSLSRRAVLRGSAALAAVSAYRPAFGQMSTAAKPSPIRLGVASFSLRTLDAAHVIEAMKQLRTPLLNLKDLHLPMTPASEVATRAAAFRAAGMQLTAAGAIYFSKDDDDDIRAKFEYVKAAGIPMIVGSPTRESLPRIEKFVKLYNIRLAIHNHGPEDKLWPSPLDVLAAVGKMDPRIGCCVDLGHTMRAGTDVVEALRKAGPRLFDIHMKDLAEATSKESQVAVGEGIMPVHAIFEQLIAMGYAGNVDLEYEIHADNPLPGMLESFAYMRGVLSGMGYSG